MKSRILFFIFIFVNLCGRGMAEEEQAIVYLSDRYILYPGAMQLSGEETLMDIFMTLPDIMTVDGTETIGLDNNGKGVASQFGQYVLRIDNVDANLDVETFLRTQKAADFEKIQIVAHPGVQKGCAGQKQVIDLTYKSGERREGFCRRTKCSGERNHTSNSIKVDGLGSTFGKASLAAADVVKTGNHTLRTFVYGNHNHRTYDDGRNTHELKEDAKVHYTWDVTKQDKFILVGTQNFSKLSTTGLTEKDYKRQYTIEGDYNHDFESGAYVLGLLNAQYQHDDIGADRNRNLYSTFVGEGGFPIVKDKLDFLLGTEVDYSGETDNVRKLTDRQLSADLYYQLSLHVGKFNISFGGRSRFSNFWMHDNKQTGSLRKYLYNDHWHLSMWYNFNLHHTLQALMTRRFYDPGFGDMRQYLIKNQQDSIRQHRIYTAEMRYTYQQTGFYLMGIVKDVNISNYWHSYVGKYSENILQTGVSAFWRKSVFSLSGGVSYNWVSCSTERNSIHAANFWVIKCNPQIHTRNGWNFSSKLVYCSRNEYEYEVYTPTNVYIDAEISKNLGKHWIARIGMRDIASQKFGNRAATIGITFKY